MAPTRSSKMDILGRRPSNYTRTVLVSEKVARDISTYVQPRQRTASLRSSRVQKGSSRNAFKTRRRLITPIRTPIPTEQTASQLPSVTESAEFVLPSSLKVRLPAKLPRVNIGKPIPRENIIAVAPEFENVPTQYLQDVYEKQGIE